MSYQNADLNLLDYGDAEFGVFRQSFRKPPVTPASQYISFIGAAQTYGRYVAKPFPELIEERLDIPCFNLGTGGAGPAQFINDTEVLRAINASELCVIQVMSGRSVNSRYFSIRAVRNAQVKDISPAILSGCPELKDRQITFAHDLLHLVSLENPTLYNAVVEDLRYRWVETYKRLLSVITTQKLLFWFSERTPTDTETNYGDGRELAKFPHLVNQEMIDEIKGGADAFEMCVSSEGMPQDLTRGGQPVLFNGDGSGRVENTYYPSPQMHKAASETLIEPIRTLWRSRPSVSGTTMKSFRPRRPRTLVHCHIPQSGGRFLNSTVFLPNFTRMNVFMTLARGTTPNEAALTQYMENHKRGCLMTGHIPYGMLDGIEWDATYFSVLRDPVERFVAFLNQAIIEKNHGVWNLLGQGVRDQARSDPDRLVARLGQEPNVIRFQCNVMTRLAAGVRREAPDPIDESTLSIAMRNIEKPNYIVGDYASLDQFASKIAEDFQLLRCDETYLAAAVDDETRYIISTPRPSRRPPAINYASLSPTSQATIRDLHSIDLKFYEAFKSKQPQLELS
ncbi:MAG: DUF6473 family protein [Pseudomonadota bacterium]